MTVIHARFSNFFEYRKIKKTLVHDVSVWQKTPSNF